MAREPRTGPELRQMEIPGQPVLLEPLAQIAERASQGALQLLQLADLAPAASGPGRRLTQGAQLRRAVIEQTPRTDTPPDRPALSRSPRPACGGGFRVGVAAGLGSG